MTATEMAEYIIRGKLFSTISKIPPKELLILMWINQPDKSTNQKVEK